MTVRVSRCGRPGGRPSARPPTRPGPTGRPGPASRAPTPSRVIQPRSRSRTGASTSAASGTDQADRPGAGQRRPARWPTAGGPGAGPGRSRRPRLRAESPLEGVGERRQSEGRRPPASADGLAEVVCEGFRRRRTQRPSRDPGRVAQRLPRGLDLQDVRPLGPLGPSPSRGAGEGPRALVAMTSLPLLPPDRLAPADRPQLGRAAEDDLGRFGGQDVEARPRAGPPPRARPSRRPRRDRPGSRPRPAARPRSRRRPASRIAAAPSRSEARVTRAAWPATRTASSPPSGASTRARARPRSQTPTDHDPSGRGLAQAGPPGQGTTSTIRPPPSESSTGVGEAGTRSVRGQDGQGGDRPVDLDGHPDRRPRRGLAGRDRREPRHRHEGRKQPDRLEIAPSSAHTTYRCPRASTSSALARILASPDGLSDPRTGVVGSLPIRDGSTGRPANWRISGKTAKSAGAATARTIGRISARSGENLREMRSRSYLVPRSRNS